MTINEAFEADSTTLYEEGMTDVTAFADGKCHFAIRLPARNLQGTSWEARAVTLTQQDIDSLRFGSSGERVSILYFRATFQFEHPPSA